jgi:hypothetical protein
MTPNLDQLLLDRLQQQGANTDEAPALLRDLSKIPNQVSGWMWLGERKTAP